MNRTLEMLDRFLKREIFVKHPDINYGGCCVFASILAPYLQKLGKVRIRVKDYDTDANAIPLARKKVKRNTVYEWNDNGVHFFHVAIELTYGDTKYHVDAEGVTNDKRFNFVNDGLTLKEATDLGDCARGWNSSFNRREIPMLKHRVKKFFDKHLKKGAKSYRLVAARSAG